MPCLTPGVLQPPGRELLILPILADEVQTGAGMTEVERSRAAPTSIIGGYGRASRAFINHSADETPRDRYLLCFVCCQAFSACPRQTLLPSCHFSEIVEDANLGYLNAYLILAFAR